MPNSSLSELINSKNNGIFVVAEIGKNFIQSEREQPAHTYLANAKN
ncbi:MAG: hypothetical protein PHW73_15005 [Atribacterota bacterium]|nr:hypothetical protein [Atribacterota bacterium]